MDHVDYLSARRAELARELGAKDDQLRQLKEQYEKLARKLESKNDKYINLRDSIAHLLELIEMDPVLSTDFVNGYLSKTLEIK